jgi:hypothetical protein
MKIITGKGLHSRAYGESEVRAEVSSMLERLGSPFRWDAENDGVLVASLEEVKGWLARAREGVKMTGKQKKDAKKVYGYLCKRVSGDGGAASASR